MIRPVLLVQSVSHLMYIFAQSKTNIAPFRAGRVRCRSFPSSPRRQSASASLHQYTAAPRHVMPCHAMPCHVTSRHAASRQTMSCHVVPSCSLGMVAHQQPPPQLPPVPSLAAAAAVVALRDAIPSYSCGIYQTSRGNVLSEPPLARFGRETQTTAEAFC